MPRAKRAWTKPPGVTAAATGEGAWGRPKPWGRVGGQVHGAEPLGGADTANRAVSAVDVAGDVHGGAQEAGAVEAVVLAECGGGTIYAIAGCADQADGGTAGPPGLQMIRAHAEAVSWGRRKILAPGEC